MGGVQFDRVALLAAFGELGRAAWAEGATIEIAVYGGSALMLIFDWRAATAEYLASNYRLEMPGWVECHGRPLRRAFFAGGLESLKAILTVESPAAFRRRLLFVGKDALDRPRRRA
jgi:hypothetical protein